MVLRNERNKRTIFSISEHTRTWWATTGFVKSKGSSFLFFLMVPMVLILRFTANVSTRDVNQSSTVRLRPLVEMCSTSMRTTAQLELKSFTVEIVIR